MPAGRPAKVDHVRNDFISSVDQSVALVKAIKGLPVKVRPSNAAGLHPKYSDHVVSLAFMGIVASWEEFLERTAVRYLTGSKTDSATAIWFLQPANNTLKQGYGPGTLLRAPVERHFGQQAVQLNLTHLEAYVEFYKGLARNIVP